MKQRRVIVPEIPVRREPLRQAPRKVQVLKLIIIHRSRTRQQKKKDDADRCGHRRHARQNQVQALLRIRLDYRFSQRRQR